MSSLLSAWPYDRLRRDLTDSPRNWLVTGVAGFIGSNLLETLLSLGQNVIGLDDFSTGSQSNIDDALSSRAAVIGRGKFRLIRGDIQIRSDCEEACHGVDFVLHQAALGSVPRSIDDPATTNAVNVGGFINMLVAAREAHVSRFVYASSCAVYGDCEAIPLREKARGNLLSPYAASKLANEIYASVFRSVYAIPVVGLRYFNVFGPRQDPNGAYAAVIPRWIDALLSGGTCEILGDGETTRDFCYVANIVQANLLAAASERASDVAEIYNVGCGTETSLNELFRMIRLGMVGYEPSIAITEASYGDFRHGDIRRSVASIEEISQQLMYEPTHTTAQGLGEALEWYVKHTPAIMPERQGAEAGAR